MGNDTIRALHGPLETANQMATLVKGLNKNGVHCRSINKVKNRFGYENRYELKDLCWGKVTKSEMLNFLKNRCLNRYDIFNLHGGYHTFAQGYTDLNLLSSEKKPMVIHHWGSEVRVLEKALQMNPYAKAKPAFTADRISKMLNMLSNKIKYCIVQDDELYQYVRNYYENIFVVPVMIDLENYQMVKRNTTNHKLLIVHAPTHTDIKGTGTVLKVIEKLQEEFDFDFKLVKDCTHDKAKKWYQQADLVIDQLHLGIYGMVSIEAMAMGTPVVCYISDFMLERYPKDVPVINANPDTLLEVMRTVLKNRDILPEIGMVSRKFVAGRHDMLKNSLKVKEIYRSILKK